jgi:hypothetical protein
MNPSSLPYVPRLSLTLIINVVTHRDMYEERALWDEISIYSLAAVPEEVKARWTNGDISNES